MTFRPYLQRLASIIDGDQGVPGLRRFVLGLALGGHLGNPADTEDAQRRDQDLAREAANLLQVDSVTLPFARLAAVAFLRKGLTPIKQATPGPFPLVVTAEERVSCDHYDFEGAAVVIPMVSSSGHGNASIKRLQYQEGQFAVGTILCAAFPREPSRVSARFLFEYLSAFKQELIVSGMVGTANVTLSLEKIGQIPVPLISASALSRLNELMAVCDQLEAAQKERGVRRDALRSISLHRLTAEDASEPADVRFFLDKSPRLITKPEHVAAVRETILDLAILGRLVPQGDDWETTSIGRLASMVTSGSRGWAEYYSPTGAKFIRAQNIRFGKLLLDDLAHVQLPRGVEGTRTQVARGDVLIVITGAGVTNPALLDAELGEAYVSQHVGLVKLHNQSFGRWILLCLMARAGARNDLLARAYGSGKPGLNLDNIRSLTIPLPPLAEQHRIVAKVDELMAVCDDLEAALTSAQDSQGRLLESLLREALVEGSGDRAVVGDFAGVV